MSRGIVSGARYGLVCGVLSLSLVGLLGRLFYLHVVDRPRLAQYAQENRKSHQPLYARRGNIVDARGNLLATTREVYEVGLDPHSVELELEPQQWAALESLLGLGKAEILEAAERRTRKVESEEGVRLSKVRWVELVDAMDEVRYRELLALKIKGLYGNRKFERLYPGGELAAHLLGFINRESTAVMGAERMMDYYLRGENGWRESERDGRRRELAQFVSREVDPRHGQHVELTVDMVIQHFVEKEVARLVEEYTPESISIIVSEPSSGDLLALANYPTFNPNLFWKSPVDKHRNRAITDVIEPGSTFKAVTIAGALEDQKVTPEDIIDCSVRRVEYRGRELKMPADHHHYGELTVREVLAKSSNPGAAVIGMLMGEDALHGYAQAFGFGARTGFGHPGESAGILHPVDRWDGLTITRMPMGHAVSATPMQIHYAMSVIANGGVYVEPRLVRRVFEGDGETAVRFQSRVRHRALSTRTARTVAGMLTGVVKPGGTAKRAAIKGFQVAGKTGTTQKIIDGGYSKQHHVASFVGFFPADNPQVVISVIVDEPKLKGNGYGGVVAAPAFRSIAEQLIRYMGIRPGDGSNVLAWKGEGLDWTR